MATVTAAQVVELYTNSPVPDRMSLYGVSNVSAGDTLDLGPSGSPQDFLAVKQAVMLATTNGGSSAACSVSGTVVTMPAGLSGDAGYLTVWGCWA